MTLIKRADPALDYSGQTIPKVNAVLKNVSPHSAVVVDGRFRLMKLAGLGHKVVEIDGKHYDISDWKQLPPSDFSEAFAGTSGPRIGRVV